MISKNINLAPMKEDDIPRAVELVRLAMNQDEAEWAKETMHFHFKCIENNIDDGRYYFVWQDDLNVLAIAGLHHYNWGPKENVWLGWFALDPDLHGKGLGSRLFDEVVSLARKMGFKKIFIETYASPTFAKARQFYQDKGFEPAGEIRNYLPQGEAMVVYMKVLEA